MNKKRLLSYFLKVESCSLLVFVAWNYTSSGAVSTHENIPEQGPERETTEQSTVPGMKYLVLTVCCKQNNEELCFCV